VQPDYNARAGLCQAETVVLEEILLNVLASQVG
jgi:hypothetical protein